MSKTTQSRVEFSDGTASSSEIRFSDGDVDTSTYPALVFNADEAPPPDADPAYMSIDDFVAELEQDPEMRRELANARRQIADDLYGDSGETLKTIRLRMGLSQADVAKAIGTRQPHVARIERGKEDLRLSTCRRLCEALSIDMNALDAALRRQNAIALIKGPQ